MKVKSFLLSFLFLAFIVMPAVLVIVNDLKDATSYIASSEKESMDANDGEIEVKTELQTVALLSAIFLPSQVVFNVETSRLKWSTHFAENLYPPPEHLI